MISILAGAFLLCLILETKFSAETVPPAVMAMAVFFVSRFTDGFVYGIIASLLSVLVLNFAFAFPYFAFNFSIPENIISAVIMLVITAMTSTITSQLKWQERVRAESINEKMRGNLLRAVSHDLRTPLTTIYGSSSAIVQNYEHLSEDQVVQLADGIREDARWLIGMVENILSITRIDNDGVKLVKTSTVLEELIDSVLTQFKKRYPDQKVNVSIPEEFTSIPMDAVLIEQVLMNLLENAVQHAKGMSVLELHVFVLGEKAVFEVQDDGCGIEKERMKGLFQDYFAVKDTPVDNQKRSMGIGLAVCASIIKAHGGVITAENRKEGGCCIRFALELEETENE
ncbi:MAG TPA: sensor histidine kinase [Lachnospiraceae bacterium]|nr:sensor histidine kinase [Lachnospiraceae bacterium]